MTTTPRGTSTISTLAGRCGGGWFRRGKSPDDADLDRRCERERQPHDERQRVGFSDDQRNDVAVAQVGDRVVVVATKRADGSLASNRVMLAAK